MVYFKSSTSIAFDMKTSETSKPGCQGQEQPLCHPQLQVFAKDFASAEVDVAEEIQLLVWRRKESRSISEQTLTGKKEYP